jgi:polyferredoxin
MLKEGFKLERCLKLSRLIPSLLSGLLVSLMLWVIYSKAPLKMLLVDRFWPSLVGVEIFLVGVYAAFITHKILYSGRAAIWRRRIWVLFSAVFFLQLLLGYLGFEKFLQTGVYHLPIPALIVAGPVYRGEGLFMLTLFLTTVVLVGPAWCSHLCYIGSWDQLTSERRRNPKRRLWNEWSRFSILFVILILAFIIGRYLSGFALWVALVYAGLSLMVIFLLSPNRGQMVHCTRICPIGWLAVVLGKINPFRIEIRSDCDGCMKCHKICRFAALERENINRKRPALSCTLCGDCLPSCPTTSLQYRFLGFRGERVRVAFVILVVSLHATFLAVARI